MTPKSKISILIKTIRKDYTNFKSYLRGALKKIEAAVEKQEDKTILSFLEAERQNINSQIKVLDEKSIEAYTEIQKIIRRLIKENETVTSENYLLEYKKKDLLLLADNLEEAYEEISVKNQELQAQKRQISAQAKKIKKVSDEIMAKNAELEQQKEFIMDQADYLHELNESITAMHEEVQKQKEEILSKNNELVSLNNEKNNLIGIVAHDLKSPLNQIKGLISLVRLSAPDLQGEALHFLETIEGSAVRMSEMIEKILDVEAIESRTLNLEMQKVKLSEILSEISDEYQVLADQKNIVIQQDYESTDLVAEVDKDYAAQVFDNLVSNAIKFSPKYTTVDVKLSTNDGNLLCEVKDQGPGLTDEDMRKLFGKYQKLSARPTGNETSTGLGLSIVKRYVEAMNGNIWCESEEGHGASFFVSFAQK